uniref:Uncharacterized protein n=1 Tax=Pyxicephalus adspersus TaxID=30357 RepID=A0AAV3AVI0_PYXAD|nr:TPA: hypothetical protein GDO54_007672 [Pyxicephalus adspersus]
MNCIHTKPTRALWPHHYKNQCLSNHQAYLVFLALKLRLHSEVVLYIWRSYVHSLPKACSHSFLCYVLRLNMCLRAVKLLIS